MKPLRALVADDEPAARSGLLALLARDDEIEVVGESADGEETRRAIAELGPDLLFLDVQMPDMNGFEVLASIESELLPVVVFVTAFDEHTLQAFEVRAVDYLLKPFTDRRFEQALERAKEQCRLADAAELRSRLEALIQERRAEPADRGRYLRRLAVGPRDDLRFLDVARVRWIEADGYRVRVHSDTGRFRLRGNLGSFEKRLDPDAFFRVSRSAIVNLSHVRGLRRMFRDRALAVLSDGTEIRIGPGRHAALVSRLEDARP